jgi:DNA-binding NtrC family response regulator
MTTQKVILSINASKAMSFVLETILENAYDIISVEDVYKATEKLKKRQDIETIVIDIDNTNSEVWDFINHVTTSRFYKRAIIVLTSDKSENFQFKLKEAKILHLYKPFTPSDFLKKIHVRNPLDN